jgi:hypothetical protein
MNGTAAGGLPSKGELAPNLAERLDDPALRLRASDRL